MRVQTSLSHPSRLTNGRYCLGSCLIACSPLRSHEDADADEDADEDDDDDDDDDGGADTEPDVSGEVIQCGCVFRRAKREEERWTRSDRPFIK